MANYELTTNGSENTQIHADKTLSLNAGLSFNVFGIDIDTMLEKNAEGMRALLCPGMHVEKQSVMLASICQAAGVSEETQASVDSVIQYIGFTGGLAETSIDVNQAFFYYSNCPDDVTPEGGTSEYAFSLAMENHFTPSGELNFPFTIKNISFSLWNTTRQKVLDTMGMGNLESALANFS